MIMDYPELVKYFASKNPLQLLLFVTPLWGTSAWFILNSSVSLLTILISVAVGVVYWTFLEYAIHRWAYHTHFKSRIINYFLGSFHLYHHKDMSDRRVYNAGFLMIYGLVPMVLSPLLLLTSNKGIIASVILGLSMAYYFYEWVHFILHYKVHEKGYLNYIQKYHFYHHDKAPLKNFGNTSHFWDALFGTYDARYKNHVLPESSVKTMITSQEKDMQYAELLSK